MLSCFPLSAVMQLYKFSTHWSYEVCVSSFKGTSDVWFSLRNTTYQNNTIVVLENIGEDSDALFCKTNLTACCRTSWYWRYEVCLQSHMCSVITLFFGCLFFGVVLHPYRHSTHLIWSTHSAHICLGSRISFGSIVCPLGSSCCRVCNHLPPAEVLPVLHP